MGPGLMEKLMLNSSPVPDSLSEPDHSQTVPEMFAQLTPREREVLQLVALGLTNRDIAQQLYISEGTVKTHITHLLTRLNLRNRSQLAIYAHSLGKQ
jgi:RNA polymerase sigma factor (sigma-70 family)